MIFSEKFGSFFFGYFIADEYIHNAYAHNGMTFIGSIFHSISHSTGLGVARLAIHIVFIVVFIKQHKLNEFAFYTFQMVNVLVRYTMSLWSL